MKTLGGGFTRRGILGLGTLGVATLLEGQTSSPSGLAPQALTTGKQIAGNFRVTNTVTNSPGFRGLWLKMKSDAVPEPMQLLLLRSALRQTHGPSDVLPMGPYKVPASAADPFFERHRGSLPSPALDTDLLPGVDWLGYGYRPFGPIINSDWASRENLFQFSDWDEFLFGQRKYLKPKILTDLLVENQGTFQRVDQHSLEETIDGIYEKFMGGADWGLFSGEFEISYSASIEKHWEYRFAAIQMALRMLRLALPDNIRQYLKPAFATALDNAAEDAKAKLAHRKMPHRTDFANFFDTWGTHYISGIHVGGAYDFYMKFENRNYTSTQEIDAKVSAAYLGLSASNSTAISQAMRSLADRQELTVTCYGGLSVPQDWSQLALWQEAVRRNPGPMSFYGDQFQGLTQIYKLVSDATCQDALKEQWKTYCASKMLRIPGIGQVVTSLNIGADKDESKAIATAKAGGFEVIPVDMNEGAKGPFIFIGKKFGDGEAEKPLLDLVAVTGSANVEAPADYYRYPTDLNRGVGGEFIYLCSTADSAGRELLLPIRNISAESFDEKKNSDFFLLNRGLIAVSEAGSHDPLDMNRGAHGKWVYVTFTRA